MASSEKPVLPLDSKALDAFALLFEVRLKAIAQRRKDTREAYPESIRTLLNEIAAPISTDSATALCGEDASVGKAAAPIFEWVASRRAELKDTLSALWKYHAEKIKLDLSKVPLEVITAMQQEREFRFFGQFVPFAARCFKNTKVPVAAPSVAAIATFLESAEKMLQANGTLLRDDYVRRALGLQELPVLRFLDEVLPGIIETFQKLDVKALYPVRNTDDTSFDRFACIETAEMLVRCFGHSNPRALALIGKMREIGAEASDEKWAADRVADAREMIARHNMRRGVFDIRYPLPGDDDLIRPFPGWSFWLGDRPAFPSLGACQPEVFGAQSG